MQIALYTQRRQENIGSLLAITDSTQLSLSPLHFILFSLLNSKIESNICHWERESRTANIDAFSKLWRVEKKKPMIKNSTHGKYNQEVETIAHGYNSPNNWLAFSYMERPRIDGTDVGGEYKHNDRTSFIVWHFCTTEKTFARWWGWVYYGST